MRVESIQAGSYFPFGFGFGLLGFDIGRVGYLINEPGSTAIDLLINHCKLMRGIMVFECSGYFLYLLFIKGTT